ncbi:MAG: prepilin-type N-terminal cleavage/methylation domain-containing protein [Rhizobacter sp.]
MHSPSNCGRRSWRGQRGVTLIEALLSFLVLAVGVLAMSKLHRHLQTHADLARQRTEAVRIAQQDIESARSYATLGQPAQASSYEHIETATEAVDRLSGQPLNTVFHLNRQIDDGSVVRMKSATVTVGWTARDGSARQVEVSSVIAGQNPAVAGALTLTPSALTAPGGAARSARIPLAAKNLADGRSAIKPVIEGTTAFVFDNLSGQVTQRCTEVPGAISTEQLTADHLTHCAEARGLLLSGTVRFSNSIPPDPETANDLPLDLALSVSLPSGVEAASPWCGAEAQKTVLYRAADGVHRVAVPLAAGPASMGAAAWSDLGERFVSYHCLVPAAGSPPRWSGASAVIPLGWTIGATAADRKVCRYAWDRDGSGAIDGNDEHPAIYSNVDRTLTQQNFLVIRGDQPCPDGAAARMDTDASAAPSRVATIQHQP